MNFRIFGLIILIFFLNISSEAQPFFYLEKEVKEYDLKAVFIYNFIRYFDWQDFEDKDFFEICILGKSDILDPLKKIAKEKFALGKPIKIRNIETLEEIGNPQILFISKYSNFEIQKILEKVKNFKVLTVGEEEGLCYKGVSINFVIREENLKFEINEKSLREAGIKPSSQILKLAVFILNGKE